MSSPRAKSKTNGEWHCCTESIHTVRVRVVVTAGVIANHILYFVDSHLSLPVSVVISEPEPAPR